MGTAPGSSWNPRKVEAFKGAFYRFLDHARINSKEMGDIVLGEHLYTAQTMVLDRLFDGLSRDVHDFKIGKSRQLGISAITRALTTFWAGVHSGLRGYMVFDTAPHAAEARIELEEMISRLPSALGFPKFKSNREGIRFENDSRIMFASAGTKRSAATGTLGRSSGINFVHASEVSSWASAEQYESFVNGLAEDFPNRLYIWETTGRGFNLWHKIWENAKADPRHQGTIFVGWWAKDNQRIDQDDEDFEKYGAEPPTAREADRLEDVLRLYGVRITREQLAWYRRKMDPGLTSLSDDASSLAEDPLRVQEQPWTETEMFQMSESVFFDADKLNEQANKNCVAPKSVWSYGLGEEFTETRIYPAPNAPSIHLKVWEEPQDDAVYIISGDSAYGHSERSDRSAAQVLRAYADGCDQVAEYAWKYCTTRQFAWVLASLLGWFAGPSGSNQVFFILEVNGSGSAVLDELRQLRKLIGNGYLSAEAEERGLRTIFRNVRDYIYTRPDSMNPSSTTAHWKTQHNNKVRIMERLRDFTASGLLHVRSKATLEEMRTITRDAEHGDYIEASGDNKDDRVIAMALALRCWEDRARTGLSTQRRTREVERAKLTLSLTDKVKIFSENQLSAFFARKAIERRQAVMAVRRASWRGGRR